MLILSTLNLNSLVIPYRPIHDDTSLNKTCYQLKSIPATLLLYFLRQVTFFLFFKIKPYWKIPYLNINYYRKNTVKLWTFSNKCRVWIGQCKCFHGDHKNNCNTGNWRNMKDILISAMTGRMSGRFSTYWSCDSLLDFNKNDTMNC